MPKKAFQVILIACSLVQASACQSPTQTPANSASNAQVSTPDFIERQVSEMTSTLNLNNQQSDQIRNIIKNYKPMGAATPEQWKKMTLDERRKNRMAAYSEREKQIEAVLTAEQKDKYERMVAERRARLGAFIATHPAPPAPPVK